MEPIHYVRSDGHHLACRVLPGEGDREIVLLTPGGTIPIDFLARDRIGARLLDGLRAIGTLVLFDRRGIGLSDPVRDWSVPLVAQWADDLADVVDAVCSRTPVVISLGDYWGPARLFAGAPAPEVEALVLYEPTGPDTDVLANEVHTDVTTLEKLPEDWLTRVCPSRGGDAAFREWFDLAGRSGAGPAVAARIYQRPPDDCVARLVAAQATITAPTLVLRKPGNPLGLAVGRDPVAEAIDGARRVDLPGADYHWLGEDVDPLLAEISHFVTGERRVPAAERFLAAVLFTDLVDSTGRAVAQGDARWRVLLDRHDDVIAQVVGRAGGTVVKSTGDGVLATLPSAQAALDVADAIRRQLDVEHLAVRIGIHVGDIEHRGRDVAGVGVHIAARVMSAAGAGDILVTESVALAVHGSNWRFSPRGAHDLKGIPGTWPLLAPDPGGG